MAFWPVNLICKKSANIYEKLFTHFQIELNKKIDDLKKDLKHD